LVNQLVLFQEDFCVTIVPRHVLGGKAYAAPSDKLNIACIGIGGRGGANLKGVGRENIVALCDVDMRRVGKTFEDYPKSKSYTDFRKMLDEMDNQIDAVVVSTPDHTHAVACMEAIRRGKHLYCEKPLAHSIYEIRELMKAAHKHKVITQLGNQGHSFDHIRVFCEWIWDGAIGNVREVHANGFGTGLLGTFAKCTLPAARTIVRLVNCRDLRKGMRFRPNWIGTFG